ncbi:DUF7693 family protein [Pseudomonas japonica]
MKTCNEPIAEQTLNVREVYQVLKDVALGTRTMRRVGSQARDKKYASCLEIDVDGWRLSIYYGCDTLDHCQSCVAPDGRRWEFDSSQRFGTDPMELMSTWELATFERLLKGL